MPVWSNARVGTGGLARPAEHSSAFCRRPQQLWIPLSGAIFADKSVRPHKVSTVS